MSRKIRKQKIVKTSTAVFFIILLALPAIIKKESISRTRNKTSPNMESALKFFGCYLEDVSDKAGFVFVHESPKLDPRLDHILPQIASMGASISVCDFNRDGWNDLYITNSGLGSFNALYQNQEDGSFRDVAADLGLANVNMPGSGVSMGSVWGDYDNDGFEDVFIYKIQCLDSFHNFNPWFYYL